MKIKAVSPCIALPGGTIRVEVEGLQDPTRVTVEVGGVKAAMVGASSSLLTVKIPHNSGEIRLLNDPEETIPCRLGEIIASDLHSVGNPVVDSEGKVYLTFSGTRGEKVPFGIFVVDREGKKYPFLAEVMNPSGLAIGPDDCLYISSRHTGAVYRSTFDKQVEKYVDGLGLATGLVFDSRGDLLVGDRGGTIYRVNSNKEVSVHCALEPSVSAYHLALAPDDTLYVSAPTLATQDCIYRISPDGESEVFFKGLGRPQGLSFDPQGRLQVAASWRGKKGLYTMMDGAPELTVSGPMLVGFAYDKQGDILYLVDNTNLYRVECERS